MKNLKTFLLTNFFIFFSLAAFSQVKIVSTGKAKLGNEWPNNDYNNEVTHEFFGLNSNSYRPGCKIALGDYGSAANGGAQAFVAEAWGWDSDQLQLHGKNGIYLTVGGGGTIVGAELNSAGDLAVKGNITCPSLTQTSDIRLKSNVKNLMGALAAISKLQGITYDFKSIREDSILQQLNVMKGKEEKDIKDLDKLKKVYEKKKLENLNQIGFSAQDIQKIFPQLVKEDEKGFLSVNYTALIPVLVEGMKEQQSVIDAQKVEIENLTKDIQAIKTKLGLR